MGKRPLSLSLRHWLLDEIELWRATGLVNRDQADAILDLYETPTQSSARHQSLAIYILVGIAASFVGLAALLLVGYNWGALHDTLKLFILLAAVAGAHAVGFGVRYGLRAKIFSEFAFFLGALFYGGAIALIADVFHLGGNPPDGLWWWALGVFPLALLLDTPLLHLLTSSLLAVWVGMQMLGGWHPADFGLRAWLEPWCGTLPLFVGLGLAWAYRKQSPTTVGLYVPLFAWWLILLPLAWHIDDAHVLLYAGGVGALLLILAEAHAPASRLAVPYRLYGALLCLGVLSIASFHEIQREFARIHDRMVFLVPTVLITLASAVAFTIALARRYRPEHMSYERPLVGFAVRQWLPLSMAALMLLMTLWYAALGAVLPRDDGLLAIVPTVAANLGMMVLAFWLLLFGLREERGLPAAGGVTFFLLWSIFRYVEWFGGRGGMLGAACMFFLCGAAIFAFAMFWHLRKKQRTETTDVLEPE